MLDIVNITKTCNQYFFLINLHFEMSIMGQDSFKKAIKVNSCRLFLDTLPHKRQEEAKSSFWL